MSPQYREEMFDKISKIIEETGSNDATYDSYKKAQDVLDVLEGLLSYAIYTTSISPETVRDSCEQSYVNIKKNALKMINKELSEKGKINPDQ